MLILFAIVVIIYVFIGFNVIKIANHKGPNRWSKMIFFSTIAAVLLAYGCLALHLPDAVSNLCMIFGISIAIFFVMKYYFLNRNKFDPVHILHIIYVWVGVSMVSTLIMELIPYRTNAMKAEWGFYTGITAAALMIVNLMVSGNNPKNKIG